MQTLARLFAAHDRNLLFRPQLLRQFSSRPRSTNLRKSDPYIAKMNQKQKDKIGGLSLLDKNWADKPMTVIKSPHKLTEVELLQTLSKIVELPEKRLKMMLKQGGENSIDEVFLLNLGQRVPQFLTATLVNLTQVLMLQKDYFRGHPIWKPLEVELHRRRNNLNNE